MSNVHLYLFLLNIVKLQQLEDSWAVTVDSAEYIAQTRLRSDKNTHQCSWLLMEESRVSTPFHHRLHVSVRVRACVL